MFTTYTVCRLLAARAGIPTGDRPLTLATMAFTCDRPRPERFGTVTPAQEVTK